MKELELGKFVRWGEAVTVDMTRKILRVLPISQPEELVEFECEDAPADDDLDARTRSY